jgi:hypothetical protein
MHPPPAIRKIDTAGVAATWIRARNGHIGDLSHCNLTA